MSDNVEKMAEKLWYAGSYPHETLAYDPESIQNRVKRGRMMAAYVLTLLDEARRDEREAAAKVAENPETPHERVYEGCDLPEAIRNGIAEAIRWRGEA